MEEQSCLLQLDGDKDTKNEIKKYSYTSSLFKLLGINALVCGVEIVSSAGFTYIPPLLLKSGFSETAMTIILGIAPFLDMITVPQLAEWSDTCTASIGRRRPFIIVLSSLLLLSLVIVPYGSTLSALLFGFSNLNMLILATGVVLLDYSYQALFNPCESLLSDLMQTSSESEQTLAFTIYSACISLGCILGYLIVSIDWAALGFVSTSQEQTAFTVIFLLFLPCVFLTLVTAKEKCYSKVLVPVNSKRDEEPGKLSGANDISIKLRDHPSDGGYESGSSDAEDNLPIVSNTSYMLTFKVFKMIYKIYRTPKKIFRKVLILIFRLFVKGIKWIFILPIQCIRLPINCWNRVSRSPVVLKRLFFAELFSWTGFMCHNMFFTDFVGQYVYGGVPDAGEQTPNAQLYDEGVRMGSWGLFLHSLTACLYAFFVQQYMVQIFTQRVVFLGGLIIFVISVFLTTFAPNIAFLNFVTALSGIGFAALTTTPNMLVTLYNTDRKKYFWDNSGSQGLGADVAVLDTAYFLSQIILSLFMGPIVDITGSSLPYMIVSVLAGIIAVYCSSKIVFNEHHLNLLKNGNF